MVEGSKFVLTLSVTVAGSLDFSDPPEAAALVLSEGAEVTSVRSFPAGEIKSP